MRYYVNDDQDDIFQEFSLILYSLMFEYFKLF